MTLLFRQTLARGHDIGLARLRARQLGEGLGLDRMGQTRLATALSEALRPIVSEGEARLTFELEGEELLIRILSAARPRDEAGGPGVSGLVAAERLVDRCEAREVGDGRREILLGRRVPARPDARALEAVTSALARGADAALDAEHAYRELSLVLAELNARQLELERVNRELEETNRGVVALYAELEEKAEALRQASEIKSRFIRNVSHEFRTPINSVLSLSRLLLDELDGPLTGEQQRQVTFIRKSAEALSELVNDLLDLAKIERGKVDVRPAPFEVSEFFSALRGMLRPLLTHERVALVFEHAPGMGTLHTDEGKVSQILRNLVSNALKFTEAGEVRVRAELEPGGVAHFAVSDTGIGIAPGDLEKIFEEFVQIEGPHQNAARGTGLGLPLSRRLAELLGGTLGVQSEVGRGSTFHLRIPARWAEASAGAPEAAPPEGGARAVQAGTVLVVDDDPASRYALRRALEGTGWTLQEAASGREGLSRATRERPDAILLDLNMPDMTGFDVLDALKADPATAAIPVIVHSSKALDAQERRRLAAASGFLDKGGVTREAAVAAIQAAVRSAAPPGATPSAGRP